MLDNFLVKNEINHNKLLSPIQIKLLNLLENKGPMTRKELVKELHTARTTIYDNLLKLQKLNQIKKYSRNNGYRGRPLVYWKLI